jgi:putative redox protein
MAAAVHFENDHGEMLAGTLHLPEGDASKGVIIGHCFTCSRHTSILRETARKLTGRGIAALRFDFSGNGQSGGDFINTAYTRHIREMELARDFLAARGILRFGLAGHSMGAAIAVLSADRIAGVAGICAVAGRLGGLDPEASFSAEALAELRRTGRIHFQSRGRKLTLSKAFFEDAARYDIQETLAALETPLLVVHGDRDEIIPATHARAAKVRNPGARVEIIPGADHMFSDAGLRERAADLMAAWFEARFER